MRPAQGRTAAVRRRPPSIFPTLQLKREVLKELRSAGQGPRIRATWQDHHHRRQQTCRLHPSPPDLQLHRPPLPSTHITRPSASHVPAITSTCTPILSPSTLVTI